MVRMTLRRLAYWGENERPIRDSSEYCFFFCDWKKNTHWRIQFAIFDAASRWRHIGHWEGVHTLCATAISGAASNLGT